MIDLTILLVFIVSSVAIMGIDFYMHRKNEVISLKSASAWSVFYVLCALSFAGFLYNYKGSESASLFLTGYSLEKVLAFDNLFVFSMIFSYFGIPENQKHKALHWGIAGAIVFRLIFVVIGAGALSMIGPTVELIFAGIIFFTVFMMYKSGDDDDVDYNKIWYVKLIRKIHPKASIFFVAVFVIEISDVMFSFDSVPAIIAVTKDPLLIYSAMIFAIMGLRSMYFVISALERYFVNMDKAVMIVLLFIASKLLVSALLGYHLNPNVSLAVIVSILSIGAISSIGAKSENE